MGNCSEPSRFSCKSVNHACMNEHFYMEIYLADTPHRRNAQHFGGGSEQLQENKIQEICHGKIKRQAEETE